MNMEIGFVNLWWHRKALSLYAMQLYWNHLFELFFSNNLHNNQNSRKSIFLGNMIFNLFRSVCNSQNKFEYSNEK